MTNKPLSRRTLLRGLGTALALPLLDSMIPAFSSAATKSPVRAAFVYFPNGVQVPSWYPQSSGDISPLPNVLPRVLEPLAPYRNDFSLLGGLTVNGGRALGEGPGDHGRAGASYLTGAQPKKSFGRDLQGTWCAQCGRVLGGRRSGRKADIVSPGRPTQTR